MTVLALGLLAVGLLACLYILIGFPAEAQTVDTSHQRILPPRPMLLLPRASRFGVNPRVSVRPLPVRLLPPGSLRWQLRTVRNQLRRDFKPS